MTGTIKQRDTFTHIQTEREREREYIYIYKFFLLDWSIYQF